MVSSVFLHFKPNKPNFSHAGRTEVNSMYDFNKKRNQKVVAIVIIVVIAAMLVTTFVSSLV